METKTNFNPKTLAMNSASAGSVAEAVAGRDSVMEPKFDGIRLLVHRTEDGVRMFARSGNEKSGKLPAIEAEVAALLPAGSWIDCEAVSFNEDGTQNWGGAQSCLGSGGTNAVLKSDSIRLVVFDVMGHGGLDARMLPFRQRRQLLELIFDGENLERVMLAPQQEATDESHEANLEAGYEGSMVKHLDAAYQSGKRSKNSLKLKMVDTVDGEIIGFGPGKPDSWIAKAGLIGKIVFRHWEDGVEVEGKCSGMTVAERQWITENQDELLGKVVEVGYMTRMPGGKLRHPQFKRLREDKTAEECRH